MRSSLWSTLKTMQWSKDHCIDVGHRWWAKPEADFQKIFAFFMNIFTSYGREEAFWALILGKSSSDLINLARSGYPTAVEITNKQTFDDFYQYFEHLRILGQLSDYRNQWNSLKISKLLNIVFAIRRILYHLSTLKT